MEIIGTHVKVRRSTSLLETEIDDEIVALDVTRGLCFGLDTVGSKIWKMLESDVTASEICGALTQEFEVSEEECIRDVRNILTQLHSEGLISTAKN